MKKKKQKLIKNIVFIAIILVLPIVIKVLHLDPLELVVVMLLIKGINNIYSDFKVGIILHIMNFGY